MLLVTSMTHVNSAIAGSTHVPDVYLYVCVLGCGVEEKHSEDIADTCDGWSCCAAEEQLCLHCCFHWQVLPAVIFLM